MDLALLFKICNYSVLPAWALLVVAPRWRGTQVIVHGLLLPLLLSVVYLVFLVMSYGSGSEGDFSSLEGVQKIFENPSGVLIGWIHYLAFDLFIGAWEARDARRVGLPHLLLVPCLVLTLIFGPTGLLLYCCLRWWRRRELVIDEAAAPSPTN